MMMRWIRFLLWTIKGGLLIVCLAILVLWVRSYWRADGLSNVAYSMREGDTAMDLRWARSESAWVCAGKIHMAFTDQTAVEVQASYADPAPWTPGWHPSSE